VETDLALPGGRTVHVYDTGSGFPVFWHHGTPQIGAVPAPLLALPGIRWLSYDRPGYGGSTTVPDRPIASAASDTAAIADFLDVASFFRPRPLRRRQPRPRLCGLAVRPGHPLRDCRRAGPVRRRRLGLVGRMVAPDELRAAVVGERRWHAARHRSVRRELFTAADHAAVSGEWSDLGRNAGLATANGSTA